MAPARRVAFAVVRRVFEDDAFADRALQGEIERAGLDARDRALATVLTYGTVQRRGTLDHVIEILAGRAPDKLDPPVQAALRLGLYQLGWLDSVPDHAVVDDSVELAKAARSRGAGLVNAVLRRATRELPDILASLTDETPEAAATKYSHPTWIARLWWEWLGPEDARALLARDNEPAEAAIRVNPLAGITPEEVAEQLGVPSHPAGPDLPEGLVLDGPFDVIGSDLARRGVINPQSRASMLVARAVDPQPGERVLDLCAAPGGKTTHLAALMGDEGEIVAVERHPGRAKALADTATRMHASIVSVQTADAAEPRPPDEEPFDRVLVDPPCSALGTLQSRSDARWRGDLERVGELARLQAAILDAAADAVAPGGVLVYSTCTISPAENEEQVAALLARRDDFALCEHDANVPSQRQTLPHRDGTDGFFIARLRRSGG